MGIENPSAGTLGFLFRSQTIRTTYISLPMAIIAYVFLEINMPDLGISMDFFAICHRIKFISRKAL